MSYQDRWLLPAGITEVLPTEAVRLEHLRRRLVDLYTRWGYEFVITPMIEYLDSLLVGTGHDLDLQTFKLTDQLTGRMMGVRADITPQVARIDAHNLKREQPTRLCYMGTVLHTRPDGFAGSRSLYQVGAELYGHAGIASDAEILSLMLATFEAAGITALHVDVGHVGIYRGLVAKAALSEAQQAELFEAMQRKARAEIANLLQQWQVETGLQQMLLSLVALNGDVQVLNEAAKALENAPEEVKAALQSLVQLTQLLPDAVLHFDLAELRGYNYHTGIVFAAYIIGQGQAIAQGGRYDDIGKVFGRARAATGFSTDLRSLTALMPDFESDACKVFAPAQVEPSEAFTATVNALRAEGEIVICGLAGQTGEAAAMGCTHELQKIEGNWQVISL
ncbi:MAG: ATP phosphoribosyltransferase regulatory subunit [Thiotrichaceae bacterium]|nr:ATP phosphoribosyltransferase regulatory subunit [Thiotrichaceae bacterium]